jgi:hypothetical protein
VSKGSYYFPFIGANVIKPFTTISYAFSQEARAFVPRKPFQPSLMFGGKAGAYLSEAPLYGILLTIFTNIRLGWKALQGKN